MAAFTKKAMSLELNPLAIGNITLSASTFLTCWAFTRNT